MIGKLSGSCPDSWSMKQPTVGDPADVEIEAKDMGEQLVAIESFNIVGMATLYQVFI